VVSGVGDEAVLVSPGGPLVAIKGTSLVSMGPLAPATLMSDPAAYRAAAEQLGAAAMARL
jgi:hypothetical protein